MAEDRRRDPLLEDLEADSVPDHHGAQDYAPGIRSSGDLLDMMAQGSSVPETGNRQRKRRQHKPIVSIHGRDVDDKAA
jgi:hypothetical protein